MLNINLKITQPSGVIIDQEVTSVLLPGVNGMIEVMYGYEALIIELGVGLITFAHKAISIKSGFAMINKSSCHIIINVNCITN